MIEQQQSGHDDEALVQPTTDEVEKDVRRVMAALAAMLAGRSEPRGECEAFPDLMMVAGAPLDGAGLLWLGSLADVNGCHVLHVSMDVGSVVPNIALAYLREGRLTLFQNCLLLLGAGDRRMVIAPDSLADGGFALDGDRRLANRRVPATLAAAMPAAKRALLRFHRLRSTIDAASVAPVRCRIG